jgi:C4-dicarboxylate-specific signal transduction histidine kinase
VFGYDYEKEICSITHEWVGKGIPPQINSLTAMPFSDVPYSLSRHRKGEFVEFPDVSMVKDKRIHAVLSEEGIQSLISVPMMDGEKAIGFIGFDIMRTKREFNSNEKNLMRLYSQMIVNVFNRMKFIEELQSTKDALSNINKSLEKKVIENTKKNIDLSRSILEQEKLVTIGEISAGIAHDLNTPLGTIRVGSDNVSYIIDKLFRDDLNNFSNNELIEIINHVKQNKIEIYVGGLQLRKEKEHLKNFLFVKYPDINEEQMSKFVDLFVKCRISESQADLIDKIIVKENGIEYLEVLNQVQMAMAQLDTIKTSSDKAVRVVQDMRAFIKGETTVERKMINLRENISTVLGVFNYEINLNIDLKFEVDESIEFMGYDIKLFQLWSNIVKNALEAMSDQDNKYFGITGVKEKDQIIVTFENNGPKIPDEIVTSIFNKFYTTKAKKSGSGLGLSIVKNVLREHKANIKIKSTENMTKFIITFEI